MGALRDFVAEVLEIEGAAIEPLEPDGLAVLAPEPLRRTMGWPELARLGFGAELPAQAMPVGLEGDWLHRFGAPLGERGRRGGRRGRAAGRPAWPGRAAGRPGAVARPCARSAQRSVALARRCGRMDALPAS